MMKTMTAFLLPMVLLISSCQLRQQEAIVRGPDTLVHEFFGAIRDQNWDRVRHLISTVDLEQEDLTAFLEGTKEIQLQTYRIVERKTISPRLVRFTVEMKFRFEDDGDLETVEQEVTATKDYNRVWRLRI